MFLCITGCEITCFLLYRRCQLMVIVTVANVWLTIFTRSVGTKWWKAGSHFSLIQSTSLQAWLMTADFFLAPIHHIFCIYLSVYVPVIEGIGFIHLIPWINIKIWYTNVFTMHPYVILNLVQQRVHHASEIDSLIQSLQAMNIFLKNKWELC